MVRLHVRSNQTRDRFIRQSLCVTIVFSARVSSSTSQFRENKSQHASSCISHVVVRVPGARAAAVKSKSIQFAFRFKFSTKFCTHTREVSFHSLRRPVSRPCTPTPRARGVDTTYPYHRRSSSSSTLVLVIHARRRRRTFRHFVRSISFRCRNVTHALTQTPRRLSRACVRVSGHRRTNAFVAFATPLRGGVSDSGQTQTSRARV